MTNKITEAAKAAGGTTYVNRHYPGETACAFGPEALRAFWGIAYRQGLEDAASECDDMAQMFAGMAHGANDGRYDHKADAAEDCAAAIRAHAKNQPESTHDTGNV